MGLIMIRCPESGREIPTGIEMDLAEFQRTPVFFPTVQCPVCKREHELFAKDAWVRQPRGNRIRLGHVHRSVVRRCSPKN